MQVKAKKHLGQHFLCDLFIAENIVNGLLDKTQKNILELGPGTGVLTQFIIEKKPENFKLIEIDHDSVDYLRNKFPSIENDIIPDDFLNMDIDGIFSDHFSIIGNFPYNISSQIFFKVLERHQQVDFVVGMLQKEVAERIASPPGSKAYGILSVLLQVYYDVEYLFTVAPHVFDPPPKVQSAVIRLTRNDVQKLDCNEKLFKQIVKMAFNQRRKTLRNSLVQMVPANESLRQLDIFSKRPEQLSVSDFVFLTQQIELLPTKMNT